MLATLLVYGNTLRAPFVYDDVLAIPANPSIRKLWPITTVLLPQAEGGLTVSGRPVLNLSFALNYAVSGTAAWSYHVFNILVHAGAGLLLFGIVRRTIARRNGASLPVAASASEWTAEPLAGARSRDSDAVNAGATPPAFAIALLWTLHPLQTQAVTYTVQRAESLTGFFYLLTLYAFIRAVHCHPLNDTSPSACSSGSGPKCHLTDDARPGDRRWLAVSVGAGVLGMGTKEIMATAPVVVLLFDRTFVAGSFRAAWRARRGYYLALAAAWALLAALVLSTGGNRGGTAGLGVGVPLWAYPLTQFEAIVRYVGLSLWPHPLVFEYGTFWVQRAADILPSAGIVLPLLAATAVALGRWPAAGFLGAFFFLILAPTSLTPGTIQMIVEHRMYLPLAAILTGAVLLMARFLPARAVIASALAMAVGFGFLTFRRNHDYRTLLALWTDTVAKRPDNPRAHEGLAEAWAAVGRHDLAIRHRAEAIRLRPEDATYHYNLGLAHMAAGQLPDAVRSFQASLRLVPNDPKAHNNLAIVLGRLGRIDAALSNYAEAVRLAPDEAQYRFNHGVALFRAGRGPESVEQFQAALILRPDHADAHFNLGTALVRARRAEEAFRHYGEALRLRPDDTDYRTTIGRAHYHEGNTLLELGRVADATTHFEVAVRLLPDDAESHHELGVAYARQERWSDAGREFEAALRLKPDYGEARRNLERLRALLTP